jgi:hypothetical protein
MKKGTLKSWLFKIFVLLIVFFMIAAGFVVIFWK